MRQAEIAFPERLRAPAGSGRRTGRRSNLVFHLAPADRLADRAEAIHRLAERLELPNPFFLPEFLGPAIDAFGRGAVELALVTDGRTGECLAFAPVGPGLDRALFGAARVFAHSHGPLSTPLMAPERAGEIAAALLTGLAAAGRRLLVLPHAPLNAPEIEALARAARRLELPVLESARRRRPILGAGSPAFERLVKGKKRKELARQMRRLADIGEVAFSSAREPDEVAHALDLFLALEASGWKGRRGTALACDTRRRRFAEAMAAGMAARGAIAVDLMRVGGRPAAGLVQLQAGGLAVPWKIAHDEAFAAYSPGAQLMARATRGWLDRGLGRVDPVCEEDNRLLAQLWADCEPYGTLVVGTTPAPLAARLSAALAEAAQRVKLIVKKHSLMVPISLLARRKRH